MEDDLKPKDIMLLSYGSITVRLHPNQKWKLEKYAGKIVVSRDFVYLSFKPDEFRLYFKEDKC